MCCTLQHWPKSGGSRSITSFVYEAVVHFKKACRTVLLRVESVYRSCDVVIVSEHSLENLMREFLFERHST